MTWNAGSITGRMELDARPHHESLSAVVMATDKASTRVNESLGKAAEGAGRKWKEELDKVKGSLGRRSAFGETIETLAGGGVAIGLGIATEQLNKMTEGLLEMKKLASKGAGWEELTMKVGESLPILGSAVKAGENIGEMLTGDKARAEEAAEGLKRWNEVLKESAKVAKEAADEHWKVEESIGSIRDQIARSGMGSPGAEIKGIKDKLGEDIRGIEKNSGRNLLSPEEQQKYDEDEVTLKTLDPKKRYKNENDFELKAVAARLNEHRKLGEQLDVDKDRDELQDWINKRRSGLEYSENELKMALDAESERANEANQRYRDLKKTHDLTTRKIDPSAQDAAEKIAALKDKAASDIKQAISNYGHQRSHDESEAAGERVALAMRPLQVLKDKIHEFGMNPEQIELYEFKKSKPGEAALKDFMETQRKLHEMNANATADQTLKGLSAQAFTAGMDDLHKKMFDMDQSEIFKADPAGLRQAKALMEEIAQASTRIKLEDQAKAFKESIASPLEKFRKDVHDLELLRDEGLITDTQFNKGAARAQAQDLGQSRNPTLLRAGSAEAMAARYDAGRPKADPMVAYQQAQTEALKQNTEELKKSNAGRTNGIGGNLSDIGQTNVLDINV